MFRLFLIYTMVWWHVHLLYEDVNATIEYTFTLVVVVACTILFLKCEKEKWSFRFSVSGVCFFWFVLVVVGGGGDGFCSFALCDHHCLFCLTYQLNDCENLYVYAVISETKIKVSFMVVILSQIN